MHEDRLVISKKFFEVFAGTTTVPPFTPQSFSVWKELLTSYLRGSYGLDTLIGDIKERESKPERISGENEADFNWRLSVFGNRDLALYLIIDKAINTAKEVDPKYRSLATSIYRQAMMVGRPFGQELFDELSLVVKGSPLHSRINAINDLVKIKMEKLGQEQHVFNIWKRTVETLNSLQVDIHTLYRMILIRAIGHVREHNGVMVSLAGMPPQNLLDLSAETILARFLASAEHNKGLKGAETEANAMLAGTTFNTEANLKRKVDVSCFNCGKQGHFASDCRSKPKTKPGSGGSGSGKKAKKA